MNDTKVVVERTLHDGRVTHEVVLACDVHLVLEDASVSGLVKSARVLWNERPVHTPLNNARLYGG